MSKLKIVAIVGGLVSLGLLGAVYLHLRKAERPAIVLQVWQTQSPELTSAWSRIAQEFQKEHPEYTVDVSYMAPSAITDGHFDGFVSDEETIDALGSSTAEALYESEYQLLYFNKDLSSSAPDTWEDLAKAAFLQTNSSDNRYGLALPEDTFAAFPLFANAVLHPEQRDSIVRSAFTTLDLLRFTYPVTPMGCHASCAASLFVKGKSPFAVAGEWRLAEFQNALGAKLGIAALPSKLPSMRRTFFLTAASELGSQKVGAFHEWSKFLQGKVGASLLFKELHKLPSSVADGRNQLQDPNAQELLKALPEKIDLSPAQYTRNLAQLEPIVKSYQKGQLTVEEASEQLLRFFGK